MKKWIKVLCLGLMTVNFMQSAQADLSDDIQGVWELTQFKIQDESGASKLWCAGSFGAIIYYQNYMSVGINCKSKPNQMLFYSGLYYVKGQTVFHDVKNYSDTSLKQIFERQIEMRDRNHLSLVGSLGSGKTAIVSWIRRESFKKTHQELAGVYRLVHSENEFKSKKGVPYCTGVFGTILYTPGGYASVSLNCPPKRNNKDEPADSVGRRFFYIGKYQVKKQQVGHLPYVSSEIELIGKVLIRDMTLVNGELSLAGVSGTPFVAVWKKMKQRR